MIFREVCVERAIHFTMVDEILILLQTGASFKVSF